MSFAVKVPVSGGPPPRPKPPPPPPPPPPPRPPRPPAATGVHTTRCIPAPAENGSGVGRQSADVFGIPPRPVTTPPRPPSSVSGGKGGDDRVGRVENLECDWTGCRGLEVVIDHGAVRRIQRLRLVFL